MAAEGRRLHINLYTEKFQSTGDRQHIAEARSSQGGHGPQEPRAERSADHRRANSGPEERPARHRCVPREMAYD
ncbi:MAG TPA: hypothetical protein VI542_07925 [Candidatus Tectomicrobia bacterium]